jgi:uncharacterized protein (TIGR02246 family)
MNRTLWPRALRKTHVLGLGIALAAVAALGCPAAPPTLDLEAEHRTLRAVMEAVNRAWENEDMEVFAQGVAHDADMVSFGADVADRWVGWEGLQRGLREQFEVFADTVVTPRHLDIKVARGGNVAWVAQAMGITTEFLGSPIAIEARFTAVFEKRDAGWRMVQFHYSIPMSESARLAR